MLTLAWAMLGIHCVNQCRAGIAGTGNISNPCCVGVVFLINCVLQSVARIGAVWKSYTLEMVVIAGMVIYLANYFMGCYKNSTLAQAWSDKNNNNNNQFMFFT